MTPRRRIGGAVAAAVLVAVAGCAEAANPQRQPESGDDGLQATGRFAGRNVAVSDGEPDVTTTCAGGVAGGDLCIVARTIDGVSLTLAVLNPDVLDADGRVDVADDGCRATACDAVTDHAVVAVDLGGDTRRAVGGSVERRAGDTRVRAAFDLDLSGTGRLTGRFDVRRP